MKNRLYKILLPVLFLIASCTSSTGEKPIPVKKDSVKVVSSSDSVISGNSSYLSDCQKLYAEAKKMDSTLLKEVEVKPAIAKKAIKAFTDFAYYCASDSLCPIYLIKTAQVAQSVNNAPQAKVVLERCVNDYTTSKHRPAALFLLAQLYDETTFLDNETEAQRLYQKIIDEYPKSDWAKSSKGALKFIGKSDEQIMEELKKK
ncbi:MAG: tetratricopeptide repeat protein [Bacteroidia bacterium]